MNKGYLSKTTIDKRTNSYELTTKEMELLADHYKWEAKKIPDTIAK